MDRVRMEERPFIRGRVLRGKSTKHTGVTTLTFQGHVTSCIMTSGDRSIGSTLLAWTKSSADCLPSYVF